MTCCTEIAIFTVEPEHASKVLALSESIFSEMNEKEKVIIDFQLLRKVNSPETICWHLTWISADAAKLTTDKWPQFPSTKEFQSLVKENIYYGHFI